MIVYSGRERPVFGMRKINPTSLSTGGFSDILNNIKVLNEKTYSGKYAIGLFNPISKINQLLV